LIKYIRVQKGQLFSCCIMIMFFGLLIFSGLNTAVFAEEIEDFPEIRREIELVDEAFKEQGLKPPRHHAYPFGGHNSTVRRIVAEYRDTARGITAGINFPPYNFENLHTVAVFENSNMEELKRWVDKVQLFSKGLLIFYTHAVLPEDLYLYDVTPEKLEEILDYAVDSGVKITTLDRAFEIKDEPRIVFTFDDGFDTDYYTVLPMFAERALLGTSYINTGKLGEEDMLTWDQVKEMIDIGWDIQCHSHTHPNLRDLVEN